MKIITPVFPHQNSSFNVTRSTKLIMTGEMSEGLFIYIDDGNGRKVIGPKFSILIVG